MGGLGEEGWNLNGCGPFNAFRGKVVKNDLRKPHVLKALDRVWDILTLRDDEPLFPKAFGLGLQHTVEGCGAQYKFYSPTLVICLIWDGGLQPV